MNSYIKSALTLSISATLWGCGSSDDNATPLSNLTPDVQINSANAKNITSAANATEDDLGKAGETSNNTRSTNTTGTPATVKDVISRITNQFISNTAQTKASTRASSFSFTTDCSGGGTMALSGRDTSFDVSFSNCKEDGDTFNGGMAMTFTESGDTENYAGDYQETGTVTFNNLSISFTENSEAVTMKLNGTLNYNETYTALTETTVGQDSTAALSMAVNAINIQFQNVIENWTTTAILETWDFNATIKTPLGVVSYATLIPFQQELSAPYPHTGKAKITGRNSSIIVTIIDTSTATLEIDNDGDGQIDETLHVTPAEIEL